MPNFNLAQIYTDATLPQHAADYLSLIQISDLHLLTDPTAAFSGVYPGKHLAAVLAALGQTGYDALLATGDLWQEPSTANFDALFAQFDTLGRPWAAIAGNHDVTLELDTHLAFEQWRRVPIGADTRLLSRRLMQSAYWDLLFIDTSVAGQTAGAVDDATLAWLADILPQSTRPCVIFAHHPMLAVGTPWIDRQGVQNAEQFWQVVAPFAQRIRAVFVGHVHQAQQVSAHGIAMYSCPATSIQFTPFTADYAVQITAPQYRWIKLLNTGTLATGTKKVVVG